MSDQNELVMTVHDVHILSSHTLTARIDAHLLPGDLLWSESAGRLLEITSIDDGMVTMKALPPKPSRFRSLLRYVFPDIKSPPVEEVGDLVLQTYAGEF